MVTWAEFAEAAPELAEAIRDLVHQFGQGFGFLATVRRDGGPRVHPVSPVITDDGLFCFLIDSPKRLDLERDGRYALHSFPADDRDDEAYLAGHAIPVRDRGRLARLAQLGRAAGTVDWHLFEFLIDAAMVGRRDRPAVTPGRPGAGSAHITVWRAPNDPTASGSPTAPCSPTGLDRTTAPGAPFTIMEAP
ncbi:pyridoxamine 5'-phosphate oxidase family protein [Actinocatenispora sera]|uniref:Pyridoxamine 5'-phosphate oxidase n=1 Tax=Actinocatenispora sera TaxID=390989 RepID=A0A810KX91_9ACTN|nr:pyridoxamine 5'-phosphate oxidase family protein [Actinocatenispora sera]BCJ26871.1 hypothetical protein Asera_09790 [Actinocatenispora sera]